MKTVNNKPSAGTRRGLSEHNQVVCSSTSCRYKTRDMVKEMTIVITVSDDTSANCDDLIHDTLDHMHHRIKEDGGFWESNTGSCGDIDINGHEAKWVYTVRKV